MAMWEWWCYVHTLRKAKLEESDPTCSAWSEDFEAWRGMDTWKHQSSMSATSEAYYWFPCLNCQYAAPRLEALFHWFSSFLLKKNKKTSSSKLNFTIHHLHRLSTVDTFLFNMAWRPLDAPSKTSFWAPPVLWQDVANGGKHRHLWGRWEVWEVSDQFLMFLPRFHWTVKLIISDYIIEIIRDQQT